jgi:hypothetical protein
MEVTRFTRCDDLCFPGKASERGAEENAIAIAAKLTSEVRWLSAADWAPV